MRKDETVKILAILEVAYPNFYKGKTASERETVLTLWSSLFACDDFNLVQVAVLKLINEFKFPPTIADVRERINDIINPQTDFGISLWNELTRAVSNSAYGSKEEFEQLSPLLKKWVKTSETLKELSQLESSVFQTVTRGQFLKNIEIEIRRERDIKTMPKSVLQVIEDFRKKSTLLELEE